MLRGGADILKHRQPLRPDPGIGEAGGQVMAVPSRQDHFPDAGGGQTVKVDVP